MIMHGLYIIIVGILTLLMTIISNGLSLDLTGFTGALSVVSGYITKAVRVTQYLYTSTTWNAIVTFIGAYVLVSISISLIMAVIKIYRGNVE